jgi:hypothetical protein
MHSADPEEPRSQFSTSTSTGTLRQHLLKFHLDEWVQECDKHGVQITAKDARDAVQSYRRRKGQNRDQANADPGPRKKYSNEAFVDALAEFIISDDQVTLFQVDSKLGHLYVDTVYQCRRISIFTWNFLDVAGRT